MAAATERFIHLARPLAHSNVGIQTNIAPLSVNIQPQVLPLTRFAKETRRRV